MMLSCSENKAWEDRRVFLGWANTQKRQISEDHHIKQYGSKKELLVLQDNLDNKVQKKNQYMCWEVDNTLCFYFHHEYTDEMDPLDAGAGNHIRFLFGVYLYEWLWDYGKVGLWYLALFPDSNTRILINHLLIKSCIKVYSQPESIEIYFTKAGCGISATG